MKKILAIAIAVVMTVALFAVTSTAADAKCLITAEQLSADTNTTKSGVSFELKEEGGEKFARFTAVDLDPHLYLSPDVTTDVANHFAVIKYRTTSEAATIDAYMAGAEPHTVFTNIEADGNWHMCYGDLEESGANWTGKFARLDPLNNGGLKEGDTIDIAWIALFASEDDAKAYTGPAAGSEPAQPAITFTEQVISGGDQSIGVWVQEGKETATVKFTTAGAFKGMSENIYWASNPTSTGPAAEWTVELYKFAYNTENTLKQKPVASKTVKSTADNDPAFTFDFDEQKAGTYIVKFTVTNAANAEDIGGEQKKPYLVLPRIAAPDASKFEYTGDGEFNLRLTGEAVSGDFFLANPAETEVPADNPGTADASVIAIAAVACVALAGVVVAKKIR